MGVSPDNDVGDPTPCCCYGEHGNDRIGPDGGDALDGAGAGSGTVAVAAVGRLLSLPDAMLSEVLGE